MKRKSTQTQLSTHTMHQNNTHSSWSVTNIPYNVMVTTEFLLVLDKCAQSWFASQLNSAFNPETCTIERRRIANNRKRPTDRMLYQDQKWIYSRDVWFRTNTCTLRPIYNLLRVDSEDARKHTFKATKICNIPSLNMFLTKQTRVALNGGYVQSTNIHSWTRSGGGIWSHICPGVGFRLFAYVHDAIKDFLGTLQYTAALPYIVYKPVGGSKEHVHFRHFTPPQLYKHLYDHVMVGGNMQQWMIKHGVHVTAHLKGGSTMFTIGPMTPWRLLVCLSVVHPDHFHSGIQHVIPSWWEHQETNRKHFVGFDNPNNLVILNRILRYFNDNGTVPLTQPDDVLWLSQFRHSTEYRIIIRTIPHTDKLFIPLKLQKLLTRTTTNMNGNFILYTNGFPYGSYANKLESCVSVQIPITPVRPSVDLSLFVQHNIQHKTTAMFLQHLYYLVTYHKNNIESVNWLQNNTVPYSIEGVQISPLDITKLMLGHFCPLLPTVRDVRLFLKQFQL